MTRNTFVRRTLDAVQLRGGVLMRADQTREGDTVMFLDPRWDYVIEEMDTTSIGQVRHRINNDTSSSSYEPGELLYIKREGMVP